MENYDNYYVELNHRDLLAISGKDSEVFLQGQLTCDLSALSSLDSCLGALCDNKGRVIASFTVWKLNDVFYLEMESGLADIAGSHLKKYSVFYKSDISKLTDKFIRLGLIGSKARDILTDIFSEMPKNANQIIESEGQFLRLLDAETQRYELWISKTSEESTEHNKYTQSLIVGKPKDWQLLDHNLGLYQLQSDDSGLYTPEELNYDLLGHISFTKGCYTGQEIVARMHYRGKAKKRLHRLLINSEQTPVKNMKITSAENKTVGEIIAVIELASSQYQVLAIANDLIQQDLLIERLLQAKIHVIF